MYGGNPVPVFQSRGFSPEPPSQGSGMSRPSAKSIYMQRKAYAESISRQQDNFQYRVEHLFTCVLDGREVSSIDDCVNRLKNMDSKGKVWGQDMIMQLQANQLQLCDIETKEFLESVHLSSIRATRAVLDSCVYDSLLIISVQDPSQRAPQAFLFQCEEIGAQEVANDLEKAIQQGGDATPLFKEPQMDIRSHLESIIGRGYPGSMKRPVLMQSNSPPPEFPPLQNNNYEDYDDRRPSSTMPFPRDEAPNRPMQSDQEQTQPPFSDVERDSEIFNHVAADIEIFTYKVGSALPKDDGKKKKKNAAKKFVASMPPVEEYISCLQKIKYGFNLLGKLDGHLKHPPASDLVHSLFSSLAFMVSQYPPNIPPTVLSPLLTEKALHLLGRCVTPNEDVLWGSLGDAWSIPRSKWPNGNQIPPYYPEFYDGWQPLPPGPSLSPPSSRQLSRSNSERFPPRNAMQRSPEQDNRAWNTPPMRRSAELPLYMRVIYDFMARNSQELSVMQGDMVQITDKSGQWWKVKNSRNEDGYVPQNVLEPVDGQTPTLNMRGPPSLDMNSRPEEVKAWLQYKGFSKMTVQTLGVFNGAMLLGMKRDDIRAICPEEGGRVFFQLQSVRSTIALASEAEYSQYGGR
ncbi:epidermal growth factor receptor kinase substrate 8-like protein 3 isoform X1 [Sinocyclocheilus anshuiensis]|uniref:epidermal growth factor receptor kinase substrate 8-like protein 3 isoform X1 n=1 Tax=Sinocyclocheilus anshuiensis TaxID=1608454 RepID=UPI0007B9A757|nr:PREDICTED: epidermal growth factor receptor kinase substrate 8-like protein 3 isoform X1 [Sinocyclocheilus anshuiensis]